MDHDPDDIRRALQLLMDRVSVEPGEGEACVVRFPVPQRDDLVNAGLSEAVADRIVGAEWFDEMVEAVIETPEFCDAGDPPEMVLRFARDAIQEYIYKRF